MAQPKLIYCADGNPAFAAAAVQAGWLYGARLPSTVYQRVYFADQDWKNPDLEKYLSAIREHRPDVATVIDWEREAQWPDVFAWMEAVIPFVKKLVVIPKVPGLVRQVPQEIQGKPIILGFSVPTSYGGTNCGLWEFGTRPVHLLGGSPQKQKRLMDYLNVVSCDGNMAAQQARKGRFWSRQKNDKGHWWQLRDSGDEREKEIPLACFRKSLENIWCFLEAA